MSGYATSARIVSASPRFADAVGVDRANRVQRNLAYSWRAEPTRLRLRPEIEDLAGPAPDARPYLAEIQDRLAGFSARWSQLTWFLLSPESWR